MGLSHPCRSPMLPHPHMFLLTTHNPPVHGNLHQAGPFQLQRAPDVLRWPHAPAEQPQQGKELLSSIFHNTERRRRF